MIGDPSKPVMTRRLLHTDAEMCIYALTVSTTKLKNIKEAMLDHNWIESTQDELNQFKRLDVWELVECPIGGNIIVVKWIWKNKTYAENTFSPGSVITTGSILVSPGSVITTGSILVSPGSVITTGSILVSPGSVITT
ncbi:hypothetical protein Tco_0998399, partial [Tanacetum coccineum]